jgi:hypothetical protein
MYSSPRAVKSALIMIGTKKIGFIVVLTEMKRILVLFRDYNEILWIGNTKKGKRKFIRNQLLIKCNGIKRWSVNVL